MAQCLYIHIPFCVKKCTYCDFLSHPFDEVMAKSYVEALCEELAMRRASATALKTIYIGGGTPSILAEESFSRLFCSLRDNYAVSSSAEITVEANPGTITLSSLHHLASLGVNRISMGVQSFNDTELRTLGRIHSSHEASESASLIREAGIGDFSLDLMYGIPGQTLGTWDETLRQAVSLNPTHLSVYELTPEANTPLYGLLESGRVSMPGEEVIIDMSGATRTFLSLSGYEQYEISNYALPGRRCRHNLNYWDRGEYIGSGAGAHSFIGNVRSRNLGDVGKYIESAAGGALPVEEAVQVSPEEAKRELIFLGMRKTEGVSRDALLSQNLDLVAHCADLIRDGYIELTSDAARFTPQGMTVSNELLVKIFQRLRL